MLRSVLSMCLHFACLVTFSCMPEQASDSALKERISSTENIICSHAEMLLHPWLDLVTLIRSVWLALTLLVFVLAIQHSTDEFHAPEQSCTRHQIFGTHFPGHNVFATYDGRVPSNSEHGTRSRYFPREFKIPKNRVPQN